ncbi:MAG: sugar ABC transporter substrate-binding protein [Microbacteriaceae bacterium]
MNRGTSAVRGIRKRSRLLSIAALVLGASLLAACSSPAAGDGDAPADDKVVLGIIGFSAADATLNKTAEEVQRQAEELGWETDYQAANPAGDSSSANSIMQVMIQKGATMIMTLAFDTDTLAAGIAAAQAADVPVLAMSAGKLSDGVVWASNVGYVPEMGDKIKEDFKDSEKVEVLNLTYLLATPGQGRNQLMQDVAKDDPKFTLTDKEVPIPGAVQGGRDFTAAWLSAHPPTEGVDLMIYAVFDQPAEGAVAALKQAGRDDVRIYSYDATPAGLALVKEGYIVADIQNGRAAQATQAIEAAQRVVSGELTIDDPELVPAAYFIVTTENVEQYEEDFPAAFTEEGV